MAKDKDPKPKPKKTPKRTIVKRKIQKAFGTAKTDPRKKWFRTARIVPVMLLAWTFGGLWGASVTAIALRLGHQPAWPAGLGTAVVVAWAISYHGLRRIT